jgi:hypothetical protein
MNISLTKAKVRYLAVLWVTIGTLLCSAAAFADAKQDARSHFDRALSLVDDGQFSEALIEFNRCYELAPHFAVQYNIAQAHIALAHPVQAVEALDRYLKEGGKAIPASRRNSVQNEILRQNARIATLNITVRPDGSTVRVDGNDLGTSPLKEPIRLGLGAHVVSASLAGYVTVDKNVELAGQDKQTLEIVLTQDTKPGIQSTFGASPVANQTALDNNAQAVALGPPLPSQSRDLSGFPPSVPQTENRGPSHGLTLRVVGLVSAGVGAAGLITGTAAYFVARAKHNDALADWNANDHTSARRLQNDADNIIKVANVGFIAGGALVGLGVVLYAISPSSSRPNTTASASFLLQPTAGRDSAGVSATGAW